MKILFYNHTGQVSGAERLLLMILARLDRAGFDPIVVCPEQDSLSRMVADLGVTVATVAGLEARFTWRVDRLARYFKSFFQVVRQLRRRVTAINPDLIHANSIRAGLVATAATFGLGTRVIWHLHDLLPRHPLSTSIRVFASLSSRTRMIAVSEAVATNFRDRSSRLIDNRTTTPAGLPVCHPSGAAPPGTPGWGPRVSVILNAIDLDKFQPDQTASRAIRGELGLNRDDLVLGIIGQLTPRKGQLELIDALARAQVPGATLLIVGAPLFNRDREYALRLEQAAASRGVAGLVRMLGARCDIGAIMQALDLLIVNSTTEPFGLVILEAMACGTPVLAAAVDGIPEIIEHGRNGWLVAPEDEGALAEAIIHLSYRPELRARLAKQGQQHVAAHFSASRYINELQGFYLERAGPVSALSGRDLSRPRFA